MTFKKNEIGSSIVTVMIASAVLLVMIASVSYFLSSQQRVSSKIEVSGSCEMIANSVRDYIQKDEANVFVTSFGPTPGTVNYPVGVNLNNDGIDQFEFESIPLRSSERVPAVSAPNIAYLSLNDNPTSGVASLGAAPKDGIAFGDPSKWIFNNQMNIRNSMTRLITLTGQVPNICCSDIQGIQTNTNCGAIVYDSDNQASSRLRGLLINEKKHVEIKLATNITSASSSLCSGGRLSRVPIASASATDFALQVVIGNGSETKTTCISRGRVSFTSDTESPATIVSLDQGSVNQLCSHNSNNPLICPSDSNQVTLNVWTVPEGDTTCRRAIRSHANQDLNCTDVDTYPRDYLTHPQFASICSNASANSAQRTVSDPGSLFLCRIGERNWFESNPDFWEPCERARVYECTGGTTPCTGFRATTATVQISYFQQPNPKVTNYYTRAQIQIGNIPANRYIKYDVRAVDTAGLTAGQSFCEYAGIGDRCNQDGYGFVRIQNTPIITSGLNPNGLIGTAAAHAAANNVTDGNTLTALSRFGASQFQCRRSPLSFSFGYGYGATVDPWIYSVFDAETTDSGEPCDGSTCTVLDFGSSLTDGPKTISASVVNACGQTSAPTSFSWCVDATQNYNLTVNDLTSNDNTYPPISSTTAPAKLCGLVYYYPRIGGGVSYVLNRNPNNRSDIDWVDRDQSGCIARPGFYNDQLCLRATDPCARVRDSERERYETTLAEQPTVNSCKQNGGPKDGNRCAPGLWCGKSGVDFKCFSESDYNYFASNCSNIPPRAPNSVATEPACYDSSQIEDTSYSPICGSQYACELNDDGNGSFDGWERLLDQAESGRSFTYSGGSWVVISPCGSSSPSTCSVEMPCDAGVCRHVPSQTCVGARCTLPGVCNVINNQTCGAPSNSLHTASGGSNLYCPDLNACSPASCNWQSSYTPCVGACGSINGTRDVVGTCPCGSCAGPNPSLTGQACEKYPSIGPDGTDCGYHWVEKNRTTCSGPCGEFGTITVNYECRDKSNVLVADSLCFSEDNRPTELIQCTKPNPAVNETGGACSCYWDLIPSTACVGDCGFTNGIQAMTATCNGAGCDIGDGTCGGIPRPALTQPCTKDPNINPTGGACGATPISCVTTAASVLPGTGCGIPGTGGILPCDDIYRSRHDCSCATCDQVLAAAPFQDFDFYELFPGVYGVVGGSNTTLDCRSAGDGCNCIFSGWIENGGSAGNADAYIWARFRFICD